MAPLPIACSRLISDSLFTTISHHTIMCSPAWTVERIGLNLLIFRDALRVFHALRASSEVLCRRPPPRRSAPVFRFCIPSGNFSSGAESNHLLHASLLGLSSQHGLAAVGVFDNRRRSSSGSAGEQVSPPPIQFSKGYPLRVLGRCVLRSSNNDSVPRAQGPTPRGAGENEMMRLRGRAP